MPDRKGASRIADVTPELKAALEAGTEESATLSEGLAIDFAALMAAVVPEAAETARARIKPADGITKRMAEAAAVIEEVVGLDAADRLAAHRSDTVRGWAAHLLARVPDLPIEERLEQLRPLGDDRHFGVREWAWLAFRPHVAADLDRALLALAAWVRDPAPNIRRIAVEISRPRGVWCAHIAELKADPDRGLPLLDPLHAEPERYVQDSVANWLNDAAKDRPDWVRGVTDRWAAASDTKATAYIVKRARRSLPKT